LGLPAVAQDLGDFSFSSSRKRQLSERIADLEARLATLETNDIPMSYGGASCCDAAGCDGCCGQPNRQQWDNSWYCKPCPGLTADAELLLLYWHDTDNDDGQDAAYTGSRYSLGYMNDYGRSIRGRYFEYASLDDTPGNGELRIEQFDLEYAGRFTLGCNWRGEIIVGGRWMYLETPQIRRWDDTIGPVFGAGVWSGFCDWMSLYCRGRQSFQFGREVFERAVTDTFSVSELGLGMELSCDVRNAALFFRTGFEAQYLASVRDDEEDYGLVGYTFGLGMSR
jgi:hypothetical protein